MLRTCVQNTYKTSIVKYGMQQFPMNKIATSTQLTTISLQQPLRKKKAEFNLLQYKSALPGSSRWLTTQAETKDSTLKQERLKYIVLAEEQSYTKPENEWRIPESESQPPKVHKPFLYFIGISAFSYTLAAYLTIKDASKAMQEAVEVTVDLEELQYKYRSKDGNTCSRWGRTSEADLRTLDRHKAILRQEEREKKVIYWCDILYVPKGIKDNLIQANRTISSTYWALPEASRSSIPILAVSTVIFVGFKLSGTGILGRKTFTILQKHFLRYPAVDRLHTLTTSIFKHSRFSNLIVNSTILCLLGGAILENDDNWTRSRRTPERTRFII